MRNIHIENVKTKKDLKKFLYFPWEVYKDDPNWVPPLIVDMKEKLDRKKNPFFEHADMELFLAYKDNKAVGRIAAILDKNHNKFHNEKIVFFGLYESFNNLETAANLLDKVAEWGRERGMEVLRGPMNLSMNDECAFLLEGFDSPPVIMMAYNPPYYLELMEKCELVKAKDLYAFYMTRDHKTAEQVEAIVENARKKINVKIRTINMKNLAEEVKRIQFIYNNAWEKNWGFVPMTDAEMDHMAKELKPIIVPDLAMFAFINDQPVGFSLSWPDSLLARLEIRILCQIFDKFCKFWNQIFPMCGA